MKKLFLILSASIFMVAMVTPVISSSLSNNTVYSVYEGDKKCDEKKAQGECKKSESKCCNKDKK